MLRNVLLAGVCSGLTLSFSTASAHDTALPYDHAPIGVMGDHLHKKGQWMTGYRYKLSTFSGFKQGHDDVETRTVLGTYGEGGIDMDMQMHMLEIMYGVTDDLTVMVMPQYMQMQMTHQSTHGAGHMHTHEDQGIGDTEVTGLYSVYRSKDGSQKAHLNIGASLPTGSIDKTFINHHGHVYNLPYNMQFGSGTVDPILGATYTFETPNWQLGAQTLNYIRVGKNENGYRQGNKYTATTWATRALTDYASLSLRLDGEAWENVSGQDSTLPITTIVGADPDKQAGERVMTSVGLNFLGNKYMGPLAGHRFAVEYGVPVYERYSGPQAEAEQRLTIGWQKAF